ncbi:helix-turn-helix transcriptional regulator [Mesonia aquimarina]|uniref:helix-turn-helix transcriptional regulator n=1 Tax=Mesonia aquimarina TaxID=1504967 RepID=UPI000EF58B9B|nr:LuxR C-terminal-related transcriptional regulator [Mesonia aquimarina]
MSDFFLKEKENDSALFYAKKAVQELKKNPYTLNNQDAIEVIYKAYLNKKQYDSAASYFELYNEVRDSVQLEKQAINVERIKLQQEYKSRLAVQKLEVEKEESKWFMIILGLLCVLLFLAIILIKYRNKIAYNKIEQALIQEKNKELNSSLDQKNSELVGKTMIDAHKSNMVKSIIEDLKLIKRKASKKETQLLLSEVLKKLERDLNPDIWKEFEFSFKQVHPSFFNKLVEKHPELSSKERRLCILLYLDFSTKEIVKLTGVSYKSVENSRTRLRNKLNLTNKKINISSYLRSVK